MAGRRLAPRLFGTANSRTKTGSSAFCGCSYSRNLIWMTFDQFCRICKRARVRPREHHIRYLSQNATYGHPWYSLKLVLCGMARGLKGLWGCTCLERLAIVSAQSRSLQIHWGYLYRSLHLPVSFLGAPCSRPTSYVYPTWLKQGITGGTRGNHATHWKYFNRTSLRSHEKDHRLGLRDMEFFF